MKKQAFLYIIFAGVLWGTSSIFVKFLASFGFSSVQMTLVRGVVSLVCMAVYSLLQNPELFKVRGKDLLLFAGSGLGLFGTATCYYASMQMTSVSTAVVLMYTAPVIVMIFSVLFLGERLTKLKVVSVVCMLVGCGLVSGIVGGLKFHALGIAIGFLSGISYSMYNIFTKIQMRKNVSPVSATLYNFAFITVLSLFVSNPAQMVQSALQNPVVTVPLMVGIGIFTCVLPYVFYTLALRELPVGTASALGIVEPMAATVFSVVLFREPLDIFSLFGIILILGAVFLLGKSKE